jgi:DNA-binding transcriptional ArsR family regulator
LLASLLSHHRIPSCNPLFPRAETAAFVYIEFMATLIESFHEAVAGRAEAALVSLAARKPQTTVAELAELLATNPTLGATTLGTLLGSGKQRRRGRPPGRKAAATRREPKPKRKAGGAAVERNVRTEAGREQFDQDVLAALRELGGDSVSATPLREAIGGGDPIQLRTSLNRLISKGLVTFSGKARGTRYSLAEEGRPQIRRGGAPGHFVFGS